MLAVAYYFLFMAIGSQGLKVLFVRELSRDIQQAPKYLGNGTWLQLAFCAFCYAALVIIVWVLPYTEDTAQVCYILGLAIIPFSLSNVTETIFQTFNKLHLMAISTVPIYIVRVTLSVVLMKLGYGIVVIAWIQVVSEVIILILQWLFILRFLKPQWRIDWSFLKTTFLMSRSFIVIEGVTVLQTRLQAVLLSLLAGEVIVGLYGAITQIMQPFQIINHSIIVSVFPTMSKSVVLGMEQQKKLTQRVLEALLLFALPTIVIIFFLGEQLLIFLYRDPEFALGADALKITAVALISVAVYRPLGYLLVANRLEHINMREVIITTILGLAIAVPLIGRFQLLGAALVYVIMQLSSFIQYVYAVYSELFKVNVWATVRRPLLLSGLTAVVLLIFVR
ncbi:MAG: oligosaccharide flippase family protein [Anaerolineae bacterium]|nr:oligosaccharide flippase family protein [Anaerolineae bacterium]